MAPQLDWRMLLGAVVAYYVTLVFYRLFFHTLARFPGPRLAAISRWYEGYYDVVLGGLYTSKIAELHKTYGAALLLAATSFCGAYRSHVDTERGQGPSSGSVHMNCI
jgi:hypothetical protein